MLNFSFYYCAVINYLNRQLQDRLKGQLCSFLLIHILFERVICLQQTPPICEDCPFQNTAALQLYYISHELYQLAIENISISNYLI